MHRVQFNKSVHMGYAMRLASTTPKDPLNSPVDTILVILFYQLTYTI